MGPGRPQKSLFSPQNSLEFQPESCTQIGFHGQEPGDFQDTSVPALARRDPSCCAFPCHLSESFYLWLLFLSRVDPLRFQM